MVLQIFIFIPEYQNAARRDGKVFFDKKIFQIPERESFSSAPLLDVCLLTAKQVYSKYLSNSLEMKAKYLLLFIF